MFEINDELVYLIEAMKVEGYWSIKNRYASIVNKNLPLLSHIEGILKNNKINYGKNLRIKVRIPNSITKDDIKITNRFFDNIKFCIESSGFDSLDKKILLILPFKSEMLNIKLKNVDFPLEVLIKPKEIKTNCALTSFGYVELRFSKMDFLKFLNEVSGKTDTNIGITSLINTNVSFIISAFGALIDCEGTIDYCKNTRRIRVRMKDKGYLDDWKSILLRCGISSYVIKVRELYELGICGWYNFKRLIDLGFKLFHPEKERKFKFLMESFIHHYIPHDKGKNICLDKLKELRRPTTLIELSKILSKNTWTIRYYLKILEKEGKIYVDKSRQSHLYLAKEIL